jgi:hypothetical protein
MNTQDVPMCSVATTFITQGKSHASCGYEQSWQWGSIVDYLLAISASV